LGVTGAAGSKAHRALAPERVYFLGKGGRDGRAQLGLSDPTDAGEYASPFDLSHQTLDWDAWLNDAQKIQS